MTRRHAGPSLATLVAVAALVLAAGPLPAADRAAQPLAEPARWLQEYLRIDSSTAAGERRAAFFLSEILNREGLATRILVSPRGHASVYARLAAERQNARAIVLLHHLDVVPPGPEWSHEPFGGDVEEGRLVGRGALDIKSLGIAHLAAMVDLARSRTPLTRDLVFLAVADEERGGLEGTGWLLERHPELFAGVDAVLGEGGSNRLINGRALWSGIEVAQKRPLWLEVSASGRRGHGSGLNPASASHRLIVALAQVLERPLTFRVSPAAKLYLGALAPLHNEKYRRIFSDLDAHVLPEGPKEALLPGLANLFLDTFQVTMLRVGEKINVIPGKATARVDARLLPDTDGETYLAGVREALGTGVEVEVLLTSAPVPPAPVSHPVYKAIAEVLDDTAPVVPAFIPGFTDSRWFRERGIPAYGVSPFFLEPQVFLGIHGPDEAIPLAELRRGIERMERIVAALVTRP